MSELANTSNNRAAIRWKLLTGVSAAALTAYVSFADVAKAEDAGQPQVWIELGGQLAQNQNDWEPYLPPFALTMPRPTFEVISPQAVQKGAPSSWDGDASIAFRPSGSQWVFSAAVLYGKANRDGTLLQQTQYPNHHTFGVYVAYQHVTSRISGSRMILDFRAGRDVGLGMGVQSTVNFGVRYAQFNVIGDTLVQSQPTNTGYYGYHRKFRGHLLADRKFNGVGPSLSWDASAALVGNTADGEISADWGADAALLFGRQSVRGHHQTTGIAYLFSQHTPYYRSAPVNRSKNVTVTNVGGFAGLSWKTQNAKVSVGYRADFFFGAMDGGIDTAHRENVGFYGPFASVSVGLGG